MFECEALEEFPLGVSNLLALEELHFATCQALKTIPESFGTLTKLKILCMYECEALEEFPLGVGNLIVLEELNFGKMSGIEKDPGKLW